MAVTIRSNRHWRPFAYRCEVPPEVLASDFGYHQLVWCPDCEETDRDDDSRYCSECGAPREPEEVDGFFCYRARWYHVDQFMWISGNGEGPFAGWHGYLNDSLFSGVVIRISDDGELYQIGEFVS